MGFINSFLILLIYFNTVIIIILLIIFIIHFNKYFLEWGLLAAFNIFFTKSIKLCFLILVVILVKSLLHYLMNGTLYIQQKSISSLLFINIILIELITHLN